MRAPQVNSAHVRALSVCLSLPLYATHWLHITCTLNDFFYFFLFLPHSSLCAARDLAARMRLARPYLFGLFEYLYRRAADKCQSDNLAASLSRSFSLARARPKRVKQLAN